MNQKTIHFQLFLSYTSLIIIIISLFTTSITYYTVGLVKDKSLESLQQYSNNISIIIENEIREMDELSTKLLFSQPFKDLVYENIYTMDNKTIIKQRELYALVYSITGPDFPVEEIRIIKPDGSYFRVGDVNEIGMNKSIGSYLGESKKKAIEEDGHYLLYGPYKSSEGDRRLSLIRSFSQHWGEDKTSIIDIQINFDTLMEKLNGTIDNKELEFYIMDAGNEIIYPYEVDTLSHSGAKDIIIEQDIGNSSWRSSLKVRQEVYKRPINRVRNIILIIGIALIFIAIFLSYIMSKKLTIPLRKIRNKMLTITLETLENTDDEQSDYTFNELEQIEMAFSSMCAKFKLNLEELISVQSKEMEAKLDALQAQMAPHFVQNTLSTISIMAEEDGNEGIVTVCDSFSGMLRYITNNDVKQVPLREELQHTINYLNLMKIRYEDYIQVDIQIPKDMLDILIPKLCIQPIVENFFKHGNNVTPPWKVNISGRLYDKKWEVMIMDNGIGFHKEFLHQCKNTLTLREALSHMNKEKQKGVGLYNIYSRLWLMYGTNSKFQVTNKVEGGACIIIGGDKGDYNVQGI